MTPKEKSEELIEKYVDIQSELEETATFHWGYAKKCALIAVDEIIELLWCTYKNKSEWGYWNEVKNELNKL